MKHNVLVFPCGSEIGLEIYRSINFSIHFQVFGASSVDDHGKYVYENYIGGLPDVDDDKFLEAINGVVDKNKIDLIMPAHDSVLLKLAKAQAAGQLNAKLVTSPLQTCEIARSKSKTYQLFKDILPVPKVFGSVSEVGQDNLPVFLKPDVGQGSKGTYLAKDLKALDFYTGNDSSLLILEYLPGKEYTVDCFTDRHGNLLFCQGRERTRVLNGISMTTSRVDDPRFKQIADRISQHLELRGAWFFQVKQNKRDELVLMEVAPRIAGTMALVRCEGVNLALLSLFDALDNDVDIFDNRYDLVLDRGLENRYRHNISYGHVYIDFDDLMIFNQKVNPSVIAFLYQCINKGIKLHLLTRHRQDLESNLIKHKLNGIFDETIWIKDKTSKANYISESDAIFIDDSFAERKAVQAEKGIPVFDSHMIEALME